MKAQLLPNVSIPTQSPGGTKHFHSSKPFALEAGGELRELDIAYHTWGQLNEKGDNVIWVCHALTANANAQEWWPNLIGPGLVWDTDNYFVVCANIIGSCYGSTGPASYNPATGEPYLHSFPFITIRDIVNAHDLLRQALGITKIHLLAGGSMGGYQVLEWAVMQPTLTEHLFVITTSPKESAWGIGIHTAQRMAIEMDSTWSDGKLTDGKEGLKVARAIGMLTYRSYESFVKSQTDNDAAKLDHYLASSYLKYQGEKLANRFSAHSYWVLTKALDSHNIARGRGEMVAVLQSIKAKTLVIGITSDILCPVQELEFLAKHIPRTTYVTIDSLYGHDGFLVETKAIATQIRQWLTLSNNDEIA